MPPRRSAAEFPNDNPELHDGLVWVCSNPCAKAIPTLRLRPSERRSGKLLQPSWAVAPDRASEPALLYVARELAESGLVHAPPEPADSGLMHAPPEPAPSEREPVHEPETKRSEVAPPQLSAFEAFVSAMVRVAMAEGASRAASLLPGLLGATAFEALPSGHALRESLVKQGVLSGDSGRLAPRFSRLSGAWWRLLEGGSGDLRALGNSTLDGFGAELLTALIPGATGSHERLRRSLRKVGVAAFGMLDAA